MEELLVQECQMLTGKVTSDLDYLVYQLLKGGTAFIDVSNTSELSESKLLDEWVKTLEEVT